MQIPVWAKLLSLFCLSVPGLVAAPRFTLTARRLPDHTLLTPVRINGAGPFVCTFDSGASRTLTLNAAIAAKAGLKPNGQGESAGEGPTVVADQRVLGATVVLGELSLPGRTVVLRPMDVGGLSDCVMGTGVLDSFVVQIDYATPEIRLYDAADFRPGPNMTNVPVTYLNGHPVIPVRIALKAGNAIDAKFLVDTAIGQWPLALHKAFIDANDILQKTDKVVTPPFSGESSGKIALLATRTASLSVGPFNTNNDVAILFRTESAVALPWDGNIGSEFFRRFTLTLDYPGNRLFLEPNAELRQPPAPFDSSGLVVRGSPGAFRIGTVLPNSPADAAGLKKDDVILSIDGVPSAQLDIHQIRRKLYRATGICVIRVQRGDSEVSATIELKPAL